jgi:tetratricopeptide (TPR) repeat protein
MLISRVWQTVTLLLLVQGWAIADDRSNQTVDFGERWAKIKFDPQLNNHIEALESLSSEIDRLAQDQPANAESMVWHAVVLSTLAEEREGVAGLALAKRAKKLLEQAELIDPEVLNGSLYTILGSLYYQVPGYPVGFGNGEKAEHYLLKALDINPDSINANFHYGDFLLHNKRYKPAIAAFEKVLSLPPRDGNMVVDTGFKREAEAALTKAKKQLQLDKVDHLENCCQ